MDTTTITLTLKRRRRVPQENILQIFENRGHLGLLMSLMRKCIEDRQTAFVHMIFGFIEEIPRQLSYRTLVFTLDKGAQLFSLYDQLSCRGRPYFTEDKAFFTTLGFAFEKLTREDHNPDEANKMKQMFWGDALYAYKFCKVNHSNGDLITKIERITSQKITRFPLH